MASNSPILKTLIYSDIFDYPLTKEEIWKFLIGRKISKESFEKSLKTTVFPLDKWEHEKGFYFLSGRGEIVKKRIKRKEESIKKLELAKKIIQKLSLIPTVLFIGISGGLALKNAKKDDDIDLFIIASKGNIWITRLIVVLLLILMVQYRGRGKKESQKVCLNMLLDESSLSFPKSRHDLYTAHEIVQLKPMFERNNTYNKFLSANKWVAKFLPNAMVRIKNKELRIKVRQENPLFMIYNSLFVFEKLAKILQLWYMKSHRTKETIGDHFLAFHPFEYKNFVLKEYNKRLKQYDPPSPRLRRVMPPKLG